ncbi:MAG: hypothetical protein U1E22_01975, partial [Coriobacteriia bacterium]|nr:hypothetical protein [Coriobacteriia bacterium]
MIKGWSIRKRRFMFVILMVLAPLTSFATLLFGVLLGEDFFSSFGGVPGLLWVVTALVLPLPFLYYSAKAAAWADLPGGGFTVLATWWALGILGALTNWSFGLADSLVQGVTLDVVHPMADGVFSTPVFLAQLGVSRSFGVQIPFFLF